MSDNKKIHKKSPKRRFRKSATPPQSRRHVLSESSGGESDDDEFPSYRSDWSKCSENTTKRGCIDVDVILTKLREVIKLIEDL